MNRKLIVFLIGTILIAIFLAPIASQLPDGLNRVAQDYHFSDKAQELTNAPIKGYKISGITNQKASTAAAGVIGIMIVMAASIGIGKFLNGRSSHGS